MNTIPLPLAKSGPTEDILRQCGHRAKALFNVLNCETICRVKQWMHSVDTTVEWALVAICIVLDLLWIWKSTPITYNNYWIFTQLLCLSNMANNFEI